MTIFSCILKAIEEDVSLVSLRSVLMLHYCPGEKAFLDIQPEILKLLSVSTDFFFLTAIQVAAGFFSERSASAPAEFQPVSSLFISIHI